MCYSRDLFFFLGRTICRREMQFWPPCRNFSPKTPNIIWLKFKTDQTVNFFSQQQISLELFLRTCRMQFLQPCMKFSPISVNLTLEFSKECKNLCVIQEICSFFSAGPSVDVECSFDHRAVLFRKNSENTLIKIQKW